MSRLELLAWMGVARQRRPGGRPCDRSIEEERVC